MGRSEEIKQAVEAASRIGIEQMYFVACGGSKAIMDAPQYIIDRETTIPSFVFTSNEFCHRTPKALGKHSVVITCSHSGNTPETVAAAKLAREKGAVSIALSFKRNSPLWDVCGYPISYDHGPDSDGGQQNNAILYALVFSLLQAIQPSEKYERALKALKTIDDVYKKNMEKYSACAATWGETNKRESVIYTLGSAPNYGAVYSFSICLLMEMLWKHTQAINSGEYFHGPFEITDYDVPFFILKGVGPDRALDERAERFVKRFSKKYEVVDCKDFSWGEIDEDLQDYFSPIIASKVIRLYAEGLAFSTGHPLTVRRYMWRLEY